MPYKEVNQRLQQVFANLLMADSVESMRAELEIIRTNSAGYEAFGKLDTIIREGRLVFASKAFELYQNGNTDQELDEFRDGLTFQAHEIFGPFTSHVTKPVTWSSIEDFDNKVHGAVLNP